MASVTSLLDLLHKAQVHAEELHIPSAEAGLTFMRRMEEERSAENEEKREERALWEQKKPEVAAYYRANHNDEIDYNDVAGACGLPPTRGNRTRIARELKLLATDTKLAAD